MAADPGCADSTRCLEIGKARCLGSQPTDPFRGQTWKLQTCCPDDRVRDYAKMLTLGPLCRVRRPHTVTSSRRLYGAVSGTHGKMDVPGADTVRRSLCGSDITPSFLRCFVRHPPIRQVLSVQMCRWTFDMHSHQPPPSASYRLFHHPPTPSKLL